jgi:hypothetical protein
VVSHFIPHRGKGELILVAIGRHFRLSLFFQNDFHYHFSPIFVKIIRYPIVAERALAL